MTTSILPAVLRRKALALVIGAAFAGAVAGARDRGARRSHDERRLHRGYWDRGADAFGVGFAFNRTSADFRRDAETLDADSDGNADYGWAASGYEKVFETYYRYRLAKQFEITPDLQLVAQPAGNRSVSMMKIVGARVQLAF